jgi:SAM-dependent methyltransferase
MDELLERWRADLAAWAIPDRILHGAVESPWTLPRHVFARRADRHMAEPGGASFTRAWEVLDPPGRVLDVGAGAGAASLPLAARATAITAVDQDESMLDAFATRVAATGVPAATVVGGWLDVAAQVPAADVVTCHHVLYNVPDLAEFIIELTAHARRRVVVEVSARHPHSPLNDLWLRFHDLRRPERPTAEDILAIIEQLGLPARHERWERPARFGYDDPDELVEITRRQLCLPPERATEVAEALAASEPSRRQLMTIWWSPRSRQSPAVTSASPT